MSAVCPRCRRPVAMARPSCVYCGAELPAAAVAEAAAARDALGSGTGPAGMPDIGGAPIGGPATAPGTVAPEAERCLLVVDLRAASAERVADGLGVSTYEASQWSRRGGFHLHRIVPAGEAARHAEELAARGVHLVIVPEAEVRAAAPLFAVAGGPRDDRLHLHTEEGEVAVGPGEVMLVAKGPIAREYPPGKDVRRMMATRLEPGYRYHLHRKGDPRPVEVDPFEFEFGAASGVTSSVLEVASWVARLFPGAPVDDAFRAMTPALAPAAPRTGRAGALEALARESATSRAPRVMFDNLAQFRFYSAWRAAVERRRA